MIIDDVMRNIARQLLAKTRESKVNWRAGDREGLCFVVTLPQTAVSIEYHPSRTGPDEYRLGVERLGNTVGDLRAIEDENDDWLLLHELWMEASRVVTGWDQALLELEQAVQGEGPIGLKPPPKASL